LPLAVLSSLDTFSIEEKEVGFALIVSFIGLTNLYFFTLGHIGTEKDSMYAKEQVLKEDDEPTVLTMQDAESTLVPVEHASDPGALAMFLKRFRSIIYKTHNRRMMWDAFTHPSFQAV
jgi:hypothetical protein